MKKNLWNTLIVALVMGMGLQACGNKGSSKPAPAPAPKPPGNTKPNNNVGGGNDIVLKNIIPQYQSIYGDITVVTPVSMSGVSIKVGTYSWAQMYSLIQPMVCGGSKSCDWSQVNYGQVYNQASPYYHSTWGQSGLIEFRNPNPNYLGYGTKQSNFGFVFNALVANNYSYYSDPYGYSYVNPGYQYQGGYYPTSYTYGNNIGGSVYINNGDMSGSFGGDMSGSFGGSYSW